MTEVKCKVQSCYYWGNGNICKADSIMVDNNSLTRNRMEVGNLDVNAGIAGTRGRPGRTGDFETADLTTGAGTRGRTGGFETGDFTTGTTTRGRTGDFEVGDLTTGPVGKPQTHEKPRAGTPSTDVLAKTSHETLCSTFKPKSAGTIH